MQNWPLVQWLLKIQEICVETCIQTLLVEFFFQDWLPSSAINGHSWDLERIQNIFEKIDGGSLKAASDSIEKTIEIKPEGLIRFKTYSRLICIESRSRSRTIRIQSGISKLLFLYILILRFCISLNKGWASTNSKCRAWFSTGKNQTWFVHFDPYNFLTVIHFHSNPFWFHDYELRSLYQ